MWQKISTKSICFRITSFLCTTWSSIAGRCSSCSSGPVKFIVLRLIETAETCFKITFKSWKKGKHATVESWRFYSKHCILQNNLFWYFCYSFLASLLTFCNAVIKLTVMTDRDYIKMPCDKIVKSRFTLTKEIMLTQRPFDVYSNIQVYCKALETWKNSQIFDLSLAKGLKLGKKAGIVVFLPKYSSSSTQSIPLHSKMAGFVDLISRSPSISNELAPIKHAHYVHLILINIVHQFCFWSPKLVVVTAIVN